MPGYKEWANHPSRKKLPKAEIDRRWKQRVVTLQSKARVRPNVSYKQVVVKTAPKPQSMKRATPKSKGGGKPSAIQKSYGQTGSKFILRPMGGKITTWSSLPLGRTPQGSTTFPMKFEVMYGTPVTASPAGVVQVAIPIIGSLWSQLAIEAPRFRKVRLREFAVEYYPKVGMNSNGSSSQYFNYSGDATVPASQAAASKIEGVVPGLVPYKQHFFRWRKQDNIDDEFVASTAAVVFNPQGHTFKLVGDGFAASQVLGDLYLFCVVEFTEYIS